MAEGHDLAPSPLAPPSVRSAFTQLVLAYLASHDTLVIRSKLKPTFTARLSNPAVVSFHHALCPVVAPQGLRHGHPAFRGTEAPKSISWVTKQPWGEECIFFLMHGSRRRLAGRQAGVPPDGHINAEMGQDLRPLSTGSLVGAPIPSPAPACSMPSPAPSAAESC